MDAAIVSDESPDTSRRSRSSQDTDARARPLMTLAGLSLGPGRLHQPDVA
jgi:hypothetical protein